MELIKMFKIITKMCQRNWLPLSTKLVAISKWTFIFVPLSVIISIVLSMHVIDFDNKKLQNFLDLQLEILKWLTSIICLLKLLFFYT